MATGSIATRSVLPPATVGVAVAILVVGGIGPNSPLAVLALVVLLLGAFLLWRPRESPILLFVFGFQWLQSSINVFQANWLGVSMVEFSSEGGDLDLAIVLTLFALLALAVGMRLGAGPWHSQDGALARSTASRFGPKYWFCLYAGAFIVAMLAQSTVVLAPGLSQPLLALASLKWAFYWMLIFATLTRRDSSRLYALIAFGLEFILGLGAYFSDFKTPLFFTLLAVVTAGIRLSLRRFLVLSSLAAMVLILGVTWTAVKEDYRHFASGGERAQIVTKGYRERIGVLLRLVSQLDANDMADASEDLLKRLSYTEYFGVVLDRVPAVLPHEGGALWWDAIRRPFMPRLFFPEKATIDDTEQVYKYVGLNRLSFGEGTSVGLGYMAETYIDFGAVGMMVPIFGFGLMLGGFYRWMLRLDPSRLLGMSLATATIYGATFLESSMVKMFGGLVVAMLASWAVLRIAPRYLPWIQRKMVH